MTGFDSFDQIFTGDVPLIADKITHRIGTQTGDAPHIHRSHQRDVTAFHPRFLNSVFSERSAFDPVRTAAGNIPVVNVHSIEIIFPPVLIVRMGGTGSAPFLFDVFKG